MSTVQRLKRPFYRQGYECVSQGIVTSCIYAYVTWSCCTYTVHIACTCLMCTHTPYVSQHICRLASCNYVSCMDWLWLSLFAKDSRTLKNVTIISIHISFHPHNYYMVLSQLYTTTNSRLHNWLVGHGGVCLGSWCRRSESSRPYSGSSSDCINLFTFYWKFEVTVGNLLTW